MEGPMEGPMEDTLQGPMENPIEHALCKGTIAMKGPVVHNRRPGPSWALYKALWRALWSTRCTRGPTPWKALWSIIGSQVPLGPYKCHYIHIDPGNKDVPRFFCHQHAKTSSDDVTREVDDGKRGYRALYLREGPLQGTRAQQKPGDKDPIPTTGTRTKKYMCNHPVLSQVWCQDLGPKIFTEIKAQLYLDLGKYLMVPLQSIGTYVEPYCLFVGYLPYFPLRAALFAECEDGPISKPHHQERQCIFAAQAL